MFYKMTQEQLFEHYNSTYEQQKDFLAKRDHFTIYILLTIVVYALLMSYPHTLTQAVDAYAKEAINFDGTLINFSILNTGLIYLLLWLLLQYYQVCLTIERWYDYLYLLEAKLSISREGGSYADNYPILKNVVNFLYTWLLPLGMASLSIERVISLFSNCINAWLDIVGLILIAIMSLLYFSDRSLQWGYFNPRKYKSLNLMSRLKGFVRLDVNEQL